jgi:hypothetical protein
MRKMTKPTPCPTCELPPFGILVDKETGGESYRFKCCDNLTDWFDTFEEAVASWDSFTKQDCPSKPRWTKDPPTTAGFYWVKYHQLSNPTIVHFANAKYKTVLTMGFGGPRGFYRIYEWYSEPIIMPERGGENDPLL